MLEPARIATESLSDGSINILTAEGILKFLLNAIKEQTSELAGSFYAALVNRINQRRDPTLISLLMYLNNHNVLNKSFDLKMATKASATKLGITLLNRLFGGTSNDDQSESDDDDIPEEAQNLTLHERLKMAVGSVKEPPKATGSNNPWKQEFILYERYHKRSPSLDKLFEALLTSQPTSTQSERNFSLAGGFVTKLRTRLSDPHLNALCFLKSHFLRFPDV